MIQSKEFNGCQDFVRIARRASKISSKTMALLAVPNGGPARADEFLRVLATSVPAYELGPVEFISR